MITLKKAIEIGEIDILQSDYTDCPDFLEFVKISLGALRRIKMQRTGLPPSSIFWLPGETKE